MAECNADKLYNAVKDLPIIDYHCHLSPKEIYEDKPFESIGQLWLDADHYKWRLMRTAGVDERYITGDAPVREKYNKFVEVLATAFHNPVREWAQAELEKYFDISLKITPENADEIWELCDKKIKEKRLSPRKLLLQSNVRYVCTTDDISDDLKYHKLLADFEVKVTPGFRTDNLFLYADNQKYVEYIKKLSVAANIQIDGLSALKSALKCRLEYFVKLGCKFSDVGVEGYPSYIAIDGEAAETFEKLLSDKPVTPLESEGLTGNLYSYLGGLYKKYGVVQQWHLAVLRNANTQALKTIGKDGGFDCVGDAIPVVYIKNMLDALNCNGALPETIIYTLNPSMNYPLATLAGSFRGVHLGVAWWFNDHRRGITNTFKTLSEVGHIESLVGMLTDSRSFLSYVRHDYFRKLLCEFLAKYAGADDYEAALSTAKKLCFDNALKLIGG